MGNPIIIIDNNASDPTVLMAKDCQIVLDWELDDEEKIKVKRSLLLTEVMEDDSLI